MNDIKLSLLTSIACKAITFINQIISLPIMISFVGINGFAKYSVLVASVSWLASLGNSLLPMLVGQISRNCADGKPNLNDHLIKNSFLLLSIIALFITIFYGVYLFFYAQFNRNELVILLLTVSMMVFSISESVRQGLGQNFINNIFNGVTNLLSILFLVYISMFYKDIFIDDKIFLLVVSFYGFLLVSKIINFFIIYDFKMKIEVDKTLMLSLLMSSKSYLFLVFCYFINNSGSVLLINKFFTNSETSEFLIFQKIFIIASGLLIMLRQPIWPYLCKEIHINGTSKIKKMFMKSESVFVILLMFGMVIFYYYEEVIISNWIGKRINFNSYDLLALCLYLFSLIYSQFLSIFYYGLELFDKVSVVVMYESIANITVGVLILYFLDDFSYFVVVLFLSNFIFSGLFVRHRILKCIKLNKVKSGKYV